MYAALLSNRYLTGRLIPLIAVGAVALCVALVVIVVSVMSGFLDMLRDSGRTLIGDVIVSSGAAGMPHYDRIVKAIEDLPQAEAATPLIDTVGLLKMPYPQGQTKELVQVQVWAVEPESFARVTGFTDRLYWQPPADEAARAAMAADDPRLHLPKEILADGAALRQGSSGKPGIVLGMHVSVANQRQQDGSYRPLYGWFMPGEDVTLTVVPVSSSGRISEPRDRVFPVVNEVQSGVFEVDKIRIFIPLSEGQSLLRMDEAPRYDTTATPDASGNFPQIGVTPARATKILVRASPGIDANTLRDAVEAAIAQTRTRLIAEGAREVPAASVRAITWEEQLSDLIAPVEKEREMMRILFSIIYLVCAGLILSIFWAIVIEKTRDIGILRSVGASRGGILWLFLRYGLVIGTIGSVCGVALAWLVVRNINAIHGAIGRDVPTAVWIAAYVASGACLIGVWNGVARSSLLRTLLWVLGTVVLALVATGLLLHHGTLIWDPSVYYFALVPDQVDWPTAIGTAIGGVVFSVLGAAVPAAKAADTDPVEALRYG